MGPIFTGHESRQRFRVVRTLYILVIKDTGKRSLVRIGRKYSLRYVYCRCVNCLASYGSDVGIKHNVENIFVRCGLVSAYP